MSNEYCENELIQQSAVDFLHDELGWQKAKAYNNEIVGEGGTGTFTFGRKSYREVLLPSRLYAALKKLNPWITDDQLIQVKAKLEEHLASASPLQINEEKYALIRDGVKVTYTDETGVAKEQTALLIDFNNPLNNDFIAVQEFKINGPVYHRRTDIIGFVNGIPLLFIELKKQTVDIYNAYVDNYRDYQNTIPQLFYYNAFIMFSNGLEAKIGTLGSKYEFFSEWKRLEENDAGSVELETMLRGVCDKKNFIDLLENYILFDHSFKTTAKVLARNHQFLGVNRAVERYANHDFDNGKLGVFWHTQGSGKSYSMIFFAKKIMRKLEGSPTFVILTDRDELNKQISGTFECCGMLGGRKASAFMATSGVDLVNKLKGNTSFIFTLIQKFNQTDEPPIIPDHDIIIISDEAHRSQYGNLAENMCRLLPTASRIGFTGTPLFSSNDITARTFGDYVSVYDFQRAVEDGATVPLYYDPRGDKLKEIQNPKITEEILDAIEQAEADENQREKLEHEFEKEIHLLIAEPRLRAIAKDFVENYSSLWQSGKAMFVCLNKVTCVRMYNLVQEYWKQAIQELEAKVLTTYDQQVALEMQRQLKWMKETEMAVVISEEQNEETTFKKWGLDIIPHRTKMNKRELDKEFKDSDNPFRIVFVCAMWLTGFDVRCLSCLYLDKPMKAHTLMQAIARANRVSEGKTNGLIIDYVGIISALKKALADYTNGSGRGGKIDPTIDKEELIAKIKELVATVKEHLKENGFELQNLVNATGFTKVALLKDAVDAVCSPIEVRKKFQVGAQQIKRLCRFVDKRELDEQTNKEIDAIIAIDELLPDKNRHVDITDLMIKVNQIINKNVQTVVCESGDEENSLFDISKIDFKVLQAEFAKTKHKKLVFKDLEETVKKRLDAMVLTNPTRADFYKKYNEIIEEYNQDKDHANIERIFMELMDLSRTMGEEAKRYARLQFDNDEQLAVFDLLFSEELTKTEVQKIKDLAKVLLDKIKQTIAALDHWRDKDVTQSQVKEVISDIIYQEAPDKIYANQEYYSGVIFDYFYNRYDGTGQQSYAGY